MDISSTNIKRLCVDAWWAAKLIWATNAVLTLGLLGTGLLQGVLPAGVVWFARGLVNAFVGNTSKGAGGIEAIIPWLLLGLVLALLEAINPLVQRFFAQRLHDDVNLKITGDILDHAARLEIAFFEDSRLREMIHRAQQGPADHCIKFVNDTQNTLINLMQALSLVGILVFIEPLILLVLAPSAIPYLFF